MKRINEIEYCWQCSHLKDLHFCEKEKRNIYSTDFPVMSEKSGFPTWCPLPDVEEKECDHPYAFVQTKCMGEINHCLKCGADL